MEAESLDGKLKCADCGTILLEIPLNAQEYDVVRCSQCHAALGTWGEIQDAFLSQAGAAFDLEDGQVRKI
jgi:hypothetical protein